MEYQDELPPIHVDRALNFETGFVLDALAYWRSVCPAGGFPSRRDLDPVAMKPYLANVSLIDIECDARGRTRLYMRLVGENLRAVYGPLHRRWADEVVAPAVMERWVWLATRLIEIRAPYRITGKVGVEGKDFIHYETLIAPLSSGSEAIDGAFAVTGLKLPSAP